MDFILFAMLGASIGWLNRTMCTGDGRLTCTINILIGVVGALLTELVLVPLLGESAQKDFAVSASLVSLGAVVPSIGIAATNELRLFRLYCDFVTERHGSILNDPKPPLQP